MYNGAITITADKQRKTISAVLPVEIILVFCLKWKMPYSQPRPSEPIWTGLAWTLKDGGRQPVDRNKLPYCDPFAIRVRKKPI